MLTSYLKSINEYSLSAVEKFSFYRDLLIEWNKKFNLTSITDKTEIEIKHFIDSLYGLNYVYGNVIDIGAGAGFPSLPLKIIKDDIYLTLVDSLNKRVTFINEVISKLNLQNVKAIHSRAEDLPKSVLYDCAVSRAVSNTQTLLEYCLPFVKKGGNVILYKSFDINEELYKSENALTVLGGKIEKIDKFTLFNTDIKRSIVIIKKIKDTPLKYPRGKNLPKLQPL